MLKAPAAYLLFVLFKVSSAPKTCQNLRVSSRAANELVYPFGLKKYKTKERLSAKMLRLSAKTHLAIDQ